MSDRLRAALDVRAGRVARFKAHAGPDPRSRFTDTWGELARQVRERADILRVFESAGYPLVRQGRECGAPCFSCGGVDRLRVIAEPSPKYGPPHYFCRQCHLWGDAIHALRNLHGWGFFDSVAHLAETLDLPVPSITDFDPHPSTHGKGPHRG
ncbi:MAG: hypothetical protein M3Q03_06425 [Chloroflexota bacterium]|nr:hypothetical protein [Chloroflexota bacterium]